MSEFEFSVTDPEKRSGGALGGHWVYHIHAKTTLPKYNKQKMLTVKRYNHFLWLREQLVLENPGCLVPPIPEKDNIKGTLEKVVGTNAPSTLVSYRMRALRKFLVRVGAHPKLQGSDLLMDFLQLTEDEFARRMKQPSRETPEIVTISATLRMTNALTSTPNTPETQRWDTTMQYFEKFESLLGDMRDRMNRMMHAFLNSSRTIRDISKVYIDMKDVESSRGVSVGSKTEVCDSMAGFARQLETLETPYEEHAYQMCIHVAESVTYYQGMCSAVICAIRRLLKLYTTRDILDEEHRRASVKQDPASKERADKVKAQLDEASKRVTEVSEELSRELERFHREKAYDFKTILTTNIGLTRELGKVQRTKWDAWATAERASTPS